MRKTFNFGQKWPGNLADNEYWIAIDPFASQLQYGDGLVVECACHSLEELEAVAAHIRSDLDRVMQEAKKKLSERQD
jgi:hypothetical protein